jgi:hypothetical protein
MEKIGVRVNHIIKYPIQMGNMVNITKESNKRLGGVVIITRIIASVMFA